MARYLIQNAHNGKAEHVVVLEGRCGVLTEPMSYEEARAAVRCLEEEARDADRWEARNPSIYR